MQGRFVSLDTPTVTMSASRHISEKALFPDEAPSDDRIINQMLHVPGNLPLKDSKVKKNILIWQGLNGKRKGEVEFANCPVSQCSLTDDLNESECADAIIFHNLNFGHNFNKSHPHQIWIFFALESPTNFYFSGNENVYSFNWTATYRRDSTLVSPYYKFTLFDKSVTKKTQLRNYALGKSKKVAWFVSNCHTRNNRLHYVKELSKYIHVDIFGSCGTKVCPRGIANQCFDMLARNYKFYLSFENSNCHDYITEKFFLNGLSHDILPVVMGAPQEDYVRVAPFNSFIHVDQFDSPQQLADYLHLLDRNDHLYNQYFSWKGSGLIDTNTFFLCRVCSLLHEAPQRKPSFFPNLKSWWQDEQCLPSGQQHWTNYNITVAKT